MPDGPGGDALAAGRETLAAGASIAGSSVELVAGVLDTELGAGVGEVPMSGPIDVRDLLPRGLSPREQRTRLAELISGESAKGSPRAYRNARRNVERWLKTGRQPSIPSRLRIQAARRRESERARGYREQGANVRMTIRWYGTRRPEKVPANEYLHIPRETMRQVVRAWEQGDSRQAADTLLAAAYARYVRAGEVDEWKRSVQVTDLNLKPGGALEPGVGVWRL